MIHDQLAKELEYGTTMCGHHQSRDDSQISQLARDPPELECGVTMCGHLCQSPNQPTRDPSELECGATMRRHLANPGMILGSAN